MPLVAYFGVVPWVTLPFSCRRATLPRPPPIFTASVVIVPSLSESDVTDTNGSSCSPAANGKVPRYTHVPPPLRWFTVNFSAPAAVLTV
ncbi:hypothetical protein IMSAGC006_02133 [Muribaculaceae bacterium]|nr:hypothetical protein IMSAGC006_02133 [Muribaculaceae bacterium]